GRARRESARGRKGPRRTRQARAARGVARALAERDPRRAQDGLRRPAARLAARAALRRRRGRDRVVARALVLALRVARALPGTSLRRARPLEPAVEPRRARALAPPSRRARRRDGGVSDEREHEERTDAACALLRRR